MWRRLKIDYFGCSYSFLISCNNYGMSLFPKLLLVTVILTSSVLGASFLDFETYPEQKHPGVLDWKGEKNYELDLKVLRKIKDRSIKDCKQINKNTAAWEFMEKNKRAETEIVLVSLDDELYPCRYVAEHLEKHHFAMASLEDVPREIAIKFESRHPVFYLKDKFYRPVVYNNGLSEGYLKHEELHLFQAANNPDLEKYMWNKDKSETTPFGKFIEGCTDFYYPTGGPGYSGYAKRFKVWLDLASGQNKIGWLERACSGVYLDFVRLGWWYGEF